MPGGDGRQDRSGEISGGLLVGHHPRQDGQRALQKIRGGLYTGI